MRWTCHARPARLGGKTCGYENTTGKTRESGAPFGGPIRDLLCCEGCGCTKIASDHRLKDQQAKEARSDIH